RPEALPAWLHGVALRVARKARARHGRATAAPVPEPPDPRPDPLDALTVRELLALLHEEVARLPEAERLPVVLCCLQGRTGAEAASQRGGSPGSVRGRLVRGRARLHARLARRGVPLPAGVLATLLTPRAADASLPAATPRLAGSPGAVPAKVTALAE